jgi:SAM-dependent methyltransferase
MDPGEHRTGYESERLLHQYLLFHYGTEEEILAGAKAFLGQEVAGLHFPSATVWSALIFDLIPEEKEGTLRALDVGCAVGRSSFELSRLCAEVVAVDYSQAFVQAAKQLQDGRGLRIMRYDEGASGTELVVARPEDCRPDLVRFEVADAMDLPSNLGSFDIVHAANLLCRLAEPRRFLERLPGLVKPGGQLVLATPCSWSLEFTPEDHQPQGATLGWLHEQLDNDFELEREIELPFVIRDHGRKFQVSTSQTSVWVRKGGE